jgi:hypothetical protein
LVKVSVSSTNTCPPPKAAVLRLCHRRYHDGYALAEGMERGVVGVGDRE